MNLRLFIALTGSGVFFAAQAGTQAQYAIGRKRLPTPWFCAAARSATRQRLALWALLLFVALLPCGTSLAADARPNVLFISIDDLNDWVGFLAGHPQVETPHMDELARRGTIFSNAHCASPLCSPSRAAVFSGRYPFNTGVLENSHSIVKLHPKLIHLPQYFGKHGYHTMGTGKTLHQRHPTLFAEEFKPEQRWSPFARNQVRYTEAELPTKGTSSPRHLIPNGPNGEPVVLPLNRMPSDRRPNQTDGESFDWGGFDIPDSAMGDGKITDWAIDQLAQQRDRPFFLAVGYYRPHIPLYAPQRYFDRYPLDSLELPPAIENDLQDLPSIAQQIATSAVTAGAHQTVLEYDQWKQAVAAYLACVTFVDAQIGRLHETLAASPHAENTIIVLWSDHGWHLGEKQHWGKWTGWERSTRVPLVIVPAKNHSEQFTTGTTCPQPVSLIDLYPTLLDLCDLPEKEDLDGQSLTPQLKDPQAIHPPVVTTFRDGHVTIRDQRWRLIRYADGSQELYDHDHDPQEWNNLAGQSDHAAVIERLSEELATVSQQGPAK